MPGIQTLELPTLQDGGMVDGVRDTVSELFRDADARAHKVMTAIAGMSIATETEKRQLDAGSIPVTEWAASVLASHIKPH